MQRHIQLTQRILESIALHAQDTYIQQLELSAGIYHISSGRGHATIAFSPLKNHFIFFADLQSVWIAVFKF